MALPTNGPTSVIRPASDRRQSRRARLGVTVTITVAGKLIDALGADVSPGGVRLVAATRAKIGDELSLVFFVGGDLVSARGSVSWCAPTPNGLSVFGVRFTALEEDGPAVLATHCGASLS